MSIVNKLSSVRLSQLSKTQTTIPKTPKFSKALNPVLNGFSDFVRQMKSADAKIDSHINKLENSEIKNMFILQQKMQSIHLTTEVVTKGGEAVFSSARRIQQMGAN